jgi:tetratricopeptide (TPR) repeat protein
MPEEVESSFSSNTMPEEVDSSLFSDIPSYLPTHNDVENSLMSLILKQPIAAPDQFRYLQDILNNVDEYCRSCFRNQGRIFTNQVFGAVGVSFKDVNDDYADMGLLKVHDAGYAAMALAKSHQYREARILLGEAQDKVKNLLKAQHPTLLPFILEIICENSTTPEFNVSKWFHRYVFDLCAIIMREQPSLTTILQLLDRVDFKLETCAMILNRIQAILGAEFGATQWQARRPVKVFCRVLRHLGRYDEVEKILPTSVGAYGSLEEPTQSESLGLLYEWAWLSARGRHDTTAARQHFEEILRRTDRDARAGEISHFRLKALRGLGILAREASRHDLSEQYFSAALRESKQGRFDRRDSNTVRIASELEESLRKLGRLDEADELRRERDELFWEKDEAVEVWKARCALFSMHGTTGFVLGDEEAVEV